MKNFIHFLFNELIERSDVNTIKNIFSLFPNAKEKRYILSDIDDLIYKLTLFNNSEYASEEYRKSDKEKLDELKHDILLDINIFIEKFTE